MAAFLSIGFRPFYLGAAVFAALAIPTWIGALLFGVGPDTGVPPYFWHLHEMLFGFAPAVIAGFLLTAVRNWTGLPTAAGRALMMLFGLWLLGRVAPFLWPPAISAAIDLTFLPVLAAALARPLWLSRNTRNLFVIGVLLVLWLANGLFHLAALGGLSPALVRSAITLGGDGVLLLMVVIGGRVIPAFSANAVPGLTPRVWPVLDHAAIGGIVLLALMDLAAVWQAERLDTLYPPLLCGLAVVHGLRLIGWQPWKTRGNALLMALPLAYLWIPVHLLLRALPPDAAGVLGPLSAHALFVGAMAGLMLAMMTRSALGHTGRPLRAGWPEHLCFLAIHLAAAVRVFGPLLLPDRYDLPLIAASLLWTLAFATFALAYAPRLTRPRVDAI